MGAIVKAPAFEGNYFPLLTGKIVVSNKKRNLRKYCFFKAFSKKKDIWRTLYISSAFSSQQISGKNSESK